LLSELAELLKKDPKAKGLTMRRQKALEDKKERKNEGRRPIVRTEAPVKKEAAVKPSILSGNEALTPHPSKADYTTKPLPEYFDGENDVEKPARWNAPKVCDYFDKGKLAACELDVKNGLIVEKLTGKPFDTSTADTHWGGGAIFVMDAKGTIYASNIQIPHEIHHSSLTNGQSVAAAGEIKVADGILEMVSNKSGHYEPSQTLNTQLFDELEYRGLDKDQLGGVERFGYKDDNTHLSPTSHQKFVDQDKWTAGDKIPYDWNDF
jgi:hypothetical protein